MAFEIKLTQGKTALVDDADAHLNFWKWCAVKDAKNFYAMKSVGKFKNVRMHHAILGRSLSGLQIDHIDGNGLNNCRSNLRFVSPRENSWNRREHRGEKNKSSKFIGVYFHKATGKWASRYRLNGTKIELGFFEKEEDAGRAYAEAINNLSGRWGRRGSLSTRSFLED